MKCFVPVTKEDLEAGEKYLEEVNRKAIDELNASIA